MVDIANEIQQKMLYESKKPKHLFNDDSLTFKQLKEVFSNVFGSNIIKVSRKVPMTSMYVTNHDGEFFISSVDTPTKLLKVNSVKNIAKLNETEMKPVDATVADVIESLKAIDPVLLNRYFANGNNKLKFSLICPPSGCGNFYGDKCFIQFDGIDCFDSDGNKVGQDNDSGVKLLKTLKSNVVLDDQLRSIDAEQLNALKRCKDEKTILKNLTDALAKLVDGIGWGCSIKYYIHDKLARTIVNKALEHNLDVSKNGAFVDELATRLSGTSSSRPTKSDLVTFAKREGIDCNSQEYKDFLNDIEATADDVSREIISPIENIIYYAVSNAANNIMGLIALDPNPKAKKILNQVASSLFDACNTIDDCSFDINNIADLTKALQKLSSYKDIAPAEIRVMNAGKPYSIYGDLTKLQSLCEVVE